jgi:hypothetical protein
MQTRQLALAVALAATLGATWWAARTPEPEETPRRSIAAAARPAAAGRDPGANDAMPGAPTLTARQFTRAPLVEQATPAVALAWGPPQPPPPPPLPKGYKPPPPPPPPLPFRPIGKLEDGAATTAFLLGGDRTYAVRAGDMIETSYRVEEVTPRRIVFTFLPLKARQELSLEGP